MPKARDSGKVISTDAARRQLVIGQRQSGGSDLTVKFNDLKGVRLNKNDSVEFDVDDSSGSEIASNFNKVTGTQAKAAPDVSLSYGQASDTSQGVELAVYVSVKRNAKLEPGLSVTLAANGAAVATPTQVTTTNSSGPVYYKVILPAGTSQCDLLAAVSESGKQIASATDLWKRTVPAKAKAKDVTLVFDGYTQPGTGNFTLLTVSETEDGACPEDDIVLNSSQPVTVELNGNPLPGTTRFELCASNAGVKVTFTQNTNMTAGLKSGKGKPKSFFLKLPTPVPAANTGGATIP